MKGKKDIILLGSTGSIGESALRLIRKNRDKFNLIGISAHNNVRLLSEIVNEFDVPNVVLSNATNAKDYFGKNELNVGSLCLIDLAKIQSDILSPGAELPVQVSLDVFTEEFLVRTVELFAFQTCVYTHLMAALADSSAAFASVMSLDLSTLSSYKSSDSF